MKKAWTAICLAAGQGKRMMSPLPKVLHPVAGLPLITHVIENCKEAGLQEIRVVAGHGLNLVKQVVEPQGVQIFIQAQPRGTGDAVRSAQVNTIEGNVIILNGDHPLVQPEDLKKFIEEFEASNQDLMLVTTELKNPKSFGRIVRSGGQIRAVVEAKDASPETLKINEVNTGIYLCKAEVLQDELVKINNKNAQGEYYLTDLISLCIEGQYKVGTISGPKRVSFGVNTQEELAEATRLAFQIKNKALLEAGVILIDPNTTYIERNVKVGSGSVIYPNVYLRGDTKLGSFVSIESNCMITDTQIGDSVQIKAGSYFEKTKIGDRATLGPYARLRPETEIGEEAHVGNFVEMKKVKFGAKSKAGHLTYLGDAEIGTEVNIGCGTITCNYAADKKKYKTKIGDRAFIGSDSQFVAPVTVGDDAVVGSGSTITKDVPAKALAVARGKQVIKENYVKEVVSTGNPTAQPSEPGRPGVTSASKGE